MPHDELSALLPFFQAMSDATRLRLVGVLAQGPRSVEQLAADLALSPSTVSHHLKRLSAMQLVSAQVDGHYHVYTLRVDRLNELSDQIRQATEAVDPKSVRR